MQVGGMLWTTSDNKHRKPPSLSRAVFRIMIGSQALKHGGGYWQPMIVIQRSPVTELSYDSLIEHHTTQRSLESWLRV
jgi:hypothetical protein